MPALDLGFLLNQATRQFRLSLASRLAESGLRPQQAAALMALGHSSDGRLTPSQLAGAIGIDAPTTSGLLRRLARDGWIASTPNPQDRRSRFVVLTPKAEQALPAVLQFAGEVSAEATACLSPDEARELARLLSRLCECGEGAYESAAR